MKDHTRDTQVCNNCGSVVVGVSRKIKGCVSCDGRGNMYIDNETPLHILLDRMEEKSDLRSSIKLD